MKTLATIIALLSVVVRAEGQNLLYQYFLRLGVDMRNLSNSEQPSTSPSDSPSLFTGDSESDAPSDVPSLSPTLLPSDVPSLIPSTSLAPSDTPSLTPSVSSAPSDGPSLVPSSMPSDAPSLIPSAAPSDAPSLLPTTFPSDVPSLEPSLTPSDVPSDAPSLIPSSMPSDTPSLLPSAVPSDVPSGAPSLSPTSFPSDMPSLAPSLTPSDVPSLQPSMQPSDYPSIVVPDYDGPTASPFTAAPTAIDTLSDFDEFIPDYSGISDDADIIVRQCGCDEKDQKVLECYEAFKTVFFENDLATGRVQWLHGTSWNKKADKAIQSKCAGAERATGESAVVPPPQPAVEDAPLLPVVRRMLRFRH